MIPWPSRKYVTKLYFEVAKLQIVSNMRWISAADHEPICREHPTPRSFHKLLWPWPDIGIFTKSGFTTLTTDWIGQILISQNGGDSSRFTRWKYKMTPKVSSKVTWFIKTTQQINGSLKSRPAGTIFVSKVAIINTKPNSIVTCKVLDQEQFREFWYFGVLKLS